MMMRREFRTVFIQIALCSVLRMGVLFVADVANYLDFCPAPLELVQHEHSQQRGYRLKLRHQLKITLYRIPFFKSFFHFLSTRHKTKRNKNQILSTKKFHGKSLWINIGLKVWLFWRCPDIYLFTRAFDDVLISDDIRNIFKEILFSSKILKKKKIGNKKKNLTQQEEKKRTRTGAGALRFFVACGYIDDGY